MFTFHTSRKKNLRLVFQIWKACITSEKNLQKVTTFFCLLPIFTTWQPSIFWFPCCISRKQLKKQNRLEHFVGDIPTSGHIQSEHLDVGSWIYLTTSINFWSQVGDILKCFTLSRTISTIPVSHLTYPAPSNYINVHNTAYGISY